MPGAKNCHAALPAALFFFLLCAPGPPGVEGTRAASKSRSRDLPAAQPGDRRTLLELLLRALRDSSSSSSSSNPQAPSHPVGAERVIVRRYTASALYPSSPLDQEARGISSSSRERVAGPRHFTSSRHLDVDLKDKFIQRFTEVFSKDSALKDKIVQHFTSPVSFSAECSKLFYRLYHNTRDCSTPSYYKRCARLLTRLAMSPQCTQS